MDEKRIQEFKSMLAGMFISHPFFTMLLMKFDVYFFSGNTTAFNKDFAIYYNREMWDRHTPEQRKFVVLHELFHILNLHKQREPPVRKFIEKMGYIYDVNVKTLVNILMDAEINDTLMYFLSTNKHSIGLDVFLRNDINVNLGTAFKKESFEKMAVKIFEKLKNKACQSCKVFSPNSLKCDVLYEGAGNGSGNQGKKKGDGSGGKQRLPKGVKDVNRIHKGTLTEEMKKKCKNKEKLKETIKDAIREVYVSMKTAGNVSQKVEEWIKKFLKSEVDWCRILRSELQATLGLDVVRKFDRVSRRHIDVDDFLIPGKKMYGIEEVVVGLDVSGSISQRELQKFLAEVLAILSDTQATVKLYQWDTKIVDVRKITQPFTEFKICGRGGTEMTPFLKEAVKDRAPFTIIFSDFELWDQDSALGYMKKLAAVSDVILVSTTDAVNYFRGKVPVKIIRVQIPEGAE